MRLGGPTVITRLLAASACLAATFALVQAPAEAATRVTISGIVTSPDAGHPRLAGIEVCASRYDKKGKYVSGKCRTTDTDGRYSISVTKGSYRFQAQQLGLYGDWMAQEHGGGKTYTVTSSRTVSFQMVRGAKVTGYLRKQDGSAPGDNSISVYAYKVYSNGKVAERHESFSNTADEGYFEVSYLPAGRYALKLDDNGYEPRLATQWYPNAATASSSTYVTVTAGQRLVSNDMTLRPGSTLRLTLKNPRSKITAGDAEIYDHDGRRTYSPYFGSNGVATFTGLYPGQYRARGGSIDANYHEWYSSKKSFATANPITVGSGATVNRSFTIHYPTLKAKKRPTVRIEYNSVVAKQPKWNKKAQSFDIVWYRDGKRMNRGGFDQIITKKPDVGHRIKACYIGYRDGYASGRTCSKYTKKIKVY